MTIYNPYKTYIETSTMILENLGFTKLSSPEDCSKCNSEKVFYVELAPLGFEMCMNKAHTVAAIYSDGGIRLLKYRGDSKIA